MRYLVCAFLAATLLAACGQKGPLYQPDEGIEVPVSGDAASPAPTTNGDGEVTTPVTPASPDRSEEQRKRIPDSPAPATRQ